jgi:hypothetical protein
VRNVVGRARGVPDISMSGACSGAVDVYQSFGGQPPAGPRPAGPARPRRYSPASWRSPTRWPITRWG